MILLWYYYIMITNLDNLRSNTSCIYVRWSKSIKMDSKRGYSLRFGTQAEAGLSACEIDPTWEDWRILRQLNEYRNFGGHCWIITGDEVGRGGDNEPLLSNIKFVGEISAELLDANWKEMHRQSQLAQWQERLSRITDAIGRKIVLEAIEALEA